MAAPFAPNWDRTVRGVSPFLERALRLRETRRIELRRSDKPQGSHRCSQNISAAPCLLPTSQPLTQEADDNMIYRMGLSMGQVPQGPTHEKR